MAWAVRKLLDAGWDTPASVRDLKPSAPEASAAERIRAIAATDYPTLVVPEQFGGAGGGVTAAAAAQRRLGWLDSGPAVALNMHTMTVGLMVDHWRRHGDTSWMLLESIANTHALIASAFAEPGGNGNFMDSRSIARESGAGYLVSGTKFPCSLYSTATLVCLTARVEGSGDTIIVLCPRSAPGIEPDGDWPSLGMHASDTGRLVLTDVNIDRRLVFYRGPSEAIDDTVAAGVVWFVVLIAATYHGILSAALELAADQVSGSSHSRRTLIGQAVRELLALGYACRGLGRDWENGVLAGQAALASAMALRANLAATRDRVATALIPVLGGRAYTREHPAATLLLDSLAVPHHPPSLLVCDDAVGAFCLGEALTFAPA